MHGGAEAVKACAVQPHVAAENFFSIEPNRQIIVGAATQIGLLVDLRLGDRVRIGDRFVDRAQGLHKVNGAERVARVSR